MALARPDTRNYFSFYSIPRAFGLDSKLLKSRFLEMSRQYHPDFYGDNAEDQNLALAISAFNNKAYKILDNEISRAQYMVELQGMEEGGQTLPQEFLMDMMDLNEAIDEMDETSKPSLAAQVNSLKDETLSQIRESAGSECWQETLVGVLKWKYLERLETRMR